MTDGFGVKLIWPLYEELISWGLKIIIGIRDPKPEL